MEQSSVYGIRFDPQTSKQLAELAKATHRTKAQAVRTAIQVAHRLFVESDSEELETQTYKEAA